MKNIVLALIFLVVLCAGAYGEKRVLVVGPESSKLIQSYTTENVTSNLKHYTCVIKGEEVPMMSSPRYTDQAELEDTIKSIEREQVHLVIFLWPSLPSRPSLFSPYFPLAFALLPHVRPNQQVFNLVIPGNEGEDNSHLGYDDLMRSLGMIQPPVFIGKNWETIQNFENLVHMTNSSECLTPLPTGVESKRGGCVANINVVETREGLKMVKDLQLGDAVLTPRGFSPVIYIENHPNTTYPCVHYGGAWVTPDHLVYPLRKKKNWKKKKKKKRKMEPLKEPRYESDQVVQVADVVNTTMTVGMEVRTVVVQGDSYFCNRVLVSSYNRFYWLPKLSFFIDWLPHCIIGSARGVFSIFM